jgi:site-specific DNA recombinase
MTKAAIYARKSTDEGGRDDKDKSVTRQIERAKAYAAEKGWAVADEHVYADDGISGAEFENRPGFARLIADLPKRRTPPFDVLIMSEASRLGRDQQRNGYYLAHIRDAGVRIFYYLDDAEERLDTPEQVLMSSVKSYAAEVERIKAGQRSRDALARRAAAGYNAGGVVYGYDNVVVEANGVRSHTDYRVNRAQADVVRRIFQMYSDGYGPVSIAKALNGDSRYADPARRYFDGARPAPPRKGTGSWAPSSIRAMLLNDRYTGVVAYGAARKVYRHGTKTRERQPAAAIQRATREDLRIITDDVWQAVRARSDAARTTYLKDTRGRLWGRPGIGVESKYLLTGLAECGCCGRNITMIGGRSGVPGKRRPIYYYGCSYHHNRGRTVCANDHKARMEEADALVISQVRKLITPDAADYIIDRALELMASRRRGRDDAPARLDDEARRLRDEIDRFVRAIGRGTAPQAVIEAISAREARLAEVGRERTAVTAPEPSELEERRLRKAFRARLGEIDALFRCADVPRAREALRKVIPGRIAFDPMEKENHRGFRLRWSVVTSALMGGYLGLASPRGFEPRLSP